MIFFSGYIKIIFFKFLFSITILRHRVFHSLFLVFYFFKMNFLLVIVAITRRSSLNYAAPSIGDASFVRQRFLFYGRPYKMLTIFEMLTCDAITMFC